MIELEVPDKGQAWVVAFAACIINMILSGLSRMIGILYVAVLDEYGVTRQQATLPFTVRNAIRCLSGPLVGVIGQRYGIRAVTFCGGIVASAGATLCCIAPNVTWLAVFWGGIHGLGFAFANTLFQVVVNQYFLKYRATASGIALSGACIGSFVFPFMIETILGTFGLSGGFLILGGIVMHVLPPSLLLKAPPWVENPEKYARLKALKMSQKSVDTVHIDVPDEDSPDDIVKHELRDMVRSTSLSNCPVEEVCSVSRSCSAERLSGQFEDTIFVRKRKKCQRDVVCTLYKISESPMIERKTSSQNGSSLSVNGTKPYEIPTLSGDIDSKANSTTPYETTAPTQQPDTTLIGSIKAIAELYTNPVYVLISICMSTYIIIFIPILTVIVDYSKDKGIPESGGKYLINAMAFGDLIGRLCFGWVTDRKIITIPVFMMLSLVLEGMIIALFPFAASLYSFMLLLALYGVTAGTVLVHFPLLVLKYVDLKAQSVAMGCVGFLSGIVSFGVPPMIGHFRDKVGSYDGMFYLTGVISVVSGCIWLFEPLMARVHHRNSRRKETKRIRKIAMLLTQNGNPETISNSNQLKPR